MRIIRSLVLTLSLILTFPCASSAQGNDSISLSRHDKIKSSIAFDIRPAYAFPSYRDDILRSCMNLDDAKKTKAAFSFHLKYGFTFAPGSKEGNIYPGAWQGIGTAINMFGNPKGLGNPIAIYLFQGAPVYHFNDRLALYYEWNFGLSTGWKPCDGHTAYSNLITGSRANAYINLGTGISWKMSSNLSFVAGIDLTHFSNGNTAFPNPGINMAGVKIGIIQSFGKRGNSTVPYFPPRQYSRTVDYKKHRKMSYDFTLYCSYRKRVYRGGEEPILLNGRFGVIGFNFAPMWNIAPIFRAGLSADFQWDESTDLRRHHISGETADDIRFYRPPVDKQIGVGVSARAELDMPLFAVNVGIGYNFIGPEETRATYQMANLRIRLVKGLFINIGYQLQNFQKQSNLMLGFGYTIR